MFGAKISSVLAGGILVLGSSAIALAQAGGLPAELPQEAAQEAQDEVSTLELGNETATNAVETRGQGDSDGDGTEFSNWVRNLELDGCERGLTIAANAQNGPTDFTEADAVEADPTHPAFTEGNCTEGGEPDTITGPAAAEQGQNNRPAEAGEQKGRDTAAQNSDGASDVEEQDAGAPAGEPGPPSEAGAAGDAGPPSDAGSRGGR